MKLIVLAGGFGTRLKTVVSNVPKPLAPVGQIPFLKFQIENWLDQGVCDFLFLLHHQADLIITFLKTLQDGILKGSRVNWLIEPVPMDTGGAIAYAVNKLNLTDDFIVANADTWLGGGIQDLLKAPAPALVVVDIKDVSRYGQVRIDRNNRVIEFLEKKESEKAGLINAGLCRLSSSQFTDWKECPFSLERDFFVKMIDCRKLTAVPLITDFIDIGIPADYERFCEWIKGGRRNKLCN